MGACTIMTLSMNKKYQTEHQARFTHQLNYIDTIFQNDSMFSIVKFENGRLTKIHLKQYINSQNSSSFGIQTISFYENGRIQFLKSNCRDTILSNGTVAYEEQLLTFDSLNQINEYQIMSDFKIICTNNKN